MFFIKRSHVGLLLMLLHWMSMQAQAQAQVEPELLMFSAMPGNPFNGLSVPLIIELYARVGVDIQVVEIPPLREELMLEQDNLDGVVGKLESVGDELTELIKISVSLAELPISIFVKGPDLGLQKLLSQRPLRFGVLRGLDYDLNLSSDIEWVRVNKPRQLMMMLSSGRLNAVITPYVAGKYYTKAYNLNEIVAMSPRYKP